MEFWGVEVKPGKPFPVVPDGDKILHLSQATLGEPKKDKANESVVIYVNIGEQKLVLGILSPEKFPQLSFDLVFEKEFELSHNCKNGSVYFCGYQTYGPEEGDEFSDLESDEEEDLPQVNGKLVPEAVKAKAPVAKASIAKSESSEKQKVKLVDPKKDSEDDESDDDDDDDDDESGEDDSDDESDEEMLAAPHDDDDDEDESDEEEEDEETPKKKAEVGKKRVNDSAKKTPVPPKKAKSETPHKSDGKKTVHVATPHPNKNAGKTPVSTKSKTQSPISGGQFSCEPCKKSFNSDKGLESHNKAKHAAK